MPDSTRPRLLIEDWLPAAAIGVECMRERGAASALPPHSFLHVWWARRPLVAARASVLGSLLPNDFPHDVFERLLGFGKPGRELVHLRSRMDAGERVEGGFGCDRAFKAGLRDADLETMRSALEQKWGHNITVIDPMSGGGSIPLESARLGLHTLANEYNPVACTILEATVDYPFRFGPELVDKARAWSRVWFKRSEQRLARFFPKRRDGLVHAYIFARTVPCPDTQKATPLVPEWHLQKTKGSGRRVVAEPIVDKVKGTWSVRIREVGNGAGQLKQAPLPTYNGGKGISLFTGLQIPNAYIKAKAQLGEVGSVLYAIAVKGPNGLDFAPAEAADVEAIEAAEAEFAGLRKEWEQQNIIPTEDIPPGVQPGSRLEIAGMNRWADLFSHRQLLVFGTLVEELNKLRAEIQASEGAETGDAVLHLLAIAFDKFANFNCALSSWAENTLRVRAKFDRHDFSYKATWAELAPFNANESVAWCFENIAKAWTQIQQLSQAVASNPAEVSQGSAASLPHLADKSITAVVVDPPYADNVQYAELANFFYVWLKRIQGYRRPEWFGTALCDASDEAVVNTVRHGGGGSSGKDSKSRAHAFYESLMAKSFGEAHRILRDDGVLTVMFTHKKQEAWEALFSSLISAGFTISATWPVKTESEHSLHQAKQNAAQSTVILVSRKRPTGVGTGYWDEELRAEIRQKARATAERLKTEGLNAVDQLVGSFGPAMEVYSRYDTVKTDTGEVIGVGEAIDEASKAVSDWRVEQLAEKGLDGVEAEGKFALLCWDVLGAAEFRFNEATLLGKAVGMDVDSLIAAGLVTKSGDKIKVVPVKERRRDRALEPEEVDLVGASVAGKRRKKSEVLKIHPNDPSFRTALDACHALALRYLEADGGAGGIGNARELMRRQNWQKGSSVARLLEALVHAAPEAIRHDDGKKTSAASMFPEFRAWHALLQPLFGIEAPDWTPVTEPQAELELFSTKQGELEEMEEEADEEEEESDE